VIGNSRGFLPRINADQRDTLKASLKLFHPRKSAVKGLPMTRDDGDFGDFGDFGDHDDPK
jgi:hypothetical protein